MVLTAFDKAMPHQRLGERHRRVRVSLTLGFEQGQLGVFVEDRSRHQPLSIGLALFDPLVSTIEQVRYLGRDIYGQQGRTLGTLAPVKRAIREPNALVEITGQVGADAVGEATREDRVGRASAMEVAHRERRRNR